MIGFDEPIHVLARYGKAAVLLDGTSLHIVDWRNLLDPRMNCKPLVSKPFRTICPSLTKHVVFSSPSRIVIVDEDKMKIAIYNDKGYQLAAKNTHGKRLVGFVTTSKHLVYMTCDAESASSWLEYRHLADLSFSHSVGFDKYVQSVYPIKGSTFYAFSLLDGRWQLFDAETQNYYNLQLGVKDDIVPDCRNHSNFLHMSTDNKTLYFLAKSESLVVCSYNMETHAVSVKVELDLPWDQRFICFNKDYMLLINMQLAGMSTIFNLNVGLNNVERYIFPSRSDFVAQRGILTDTSALLTDDKGLFCIVQGDSSKKDKLCKSKLCKSKL